MREYLTPGGVLDGYEQDGTVIYTVRMDMDFDWTGAMHMPREMLSTMYRRVERGLGTSIVYPLMLPRELLDLHVGALLPAMPDAYASGLGIRRRGEEWEWRFEFPDGPVRTVQYGLTTHETLVAMRFTRRQEVN